MANLVNGKKDELNTHSRSIMMEFMDRIKANEFNDSVVEDLKNELVTRERSKRASALAIGYDNIQKLDHELKKIRADQVFYNEDGAVAREEWSKNKIEEKKKLIERIEKYDRAFGKAIGGDFKDLYDLNNNFKDKGGSGKESSGDSSSKAD